MKDLFEKRGMYGQFPSIADRIDATGDCWEWTGYIRPDGYPHTTMMVNGVQKQKLAHRVVYEMLVGDIPDGLDIDHLCRVRHCVKPDHLEPVTRSENMKRSGAIAQGLHRIHEEKRARTHCSNGHEFTEENTKWRTDNNGRRCRTCHA